MTDIPRKCLAFLIGTRCQEYSRERLAKAVGIGFRTADKALRLLVDIGAITKHHGGRGTPCRITVCMDLETFCARYARYVQKSARYVGEKCALSDDLNLKEVKKEREQFFPQPQTPEARLRAQARRNLGAGASVAEIVAEMQRLEDSGFLAERIPPASETQSTEIGRVAV